MNTEQTSTSATTDNTVDGIFSPKEQALAPHESLFTSFHEAFARPMAFHEGADISFGSSAPAHDSGDAWLNLSSTAPALLVEPFEHVLLDILGLSHHPVTLTHVDGVGNVDSASQDLGLMTGADIANVGPMTGEGIVAPFENALSDYMGEHNGAVAMIDSMPPHAGVESEGQPGANFTDAGSTLGEGVVAPLEASISDLLGDGNGNFGGVTSGLAHGTVESGGADIGNLASATGSGIVSPFESGLSDYLSPTNGAASTIDSAPPAAGVESNGLGGSNFSSVGSTTGDSVVAPFESALSDFLGPDGGPLGGGVASSGINTGIDSVGSDFNNVGATSGDGIAQPFEGALGYYLSPDASVAAVIESNSPAAGVESGAPEGSSLMAAASTTGDGIVAPLESAITDLLGSGSALGGGVTSQANPGGVDSQGSDVGNIATATGDGIVAPFETALNGYLNPDSGNDGAQVISENPPGAGVESQDNPFLQLSLEQLVDVPVVAGDIGDTLSGAAAGGIDSDGFAPPFVIPSGNNGGDIISSISQNLGINPTITVPTDPYLPPLNQETTPIKPTVSNEVGTNPVAEADLLGRGSAGLVGAGFEPQIIGNLLSQGTSFGSGGGEFVALHVLSGTSDGVSNINPALGTETFAPNEITATDQYGNTLMLNQSTGQYIYTLNNPFPNTNNQPEIETFQFTAQNVDGQTASANIVFTIGDDSPIATAEVVPVGPLSEASLPAGTAPNAAATAVMGNLIGSGTTFGADTAGAGVTALVLTSATSNGVTNDTQPLPATLAGGDITVTDSTGNTLSVDQATGAYTFQLNNPYQNINSQPEVLTYTYTLTDGDGSVASNTITINVGDDTPIAIAQAGAATLTEASLPAGTAPNAAATSTSGNLLTGDKFGADGAAAGGGVSVVFTSGTSNGISNDTATAVVAGGNTVITDSAGNVLTVNDTTGAYTYKLNAPYHDNANQPEVLTYTYTLQDSDGSTASNTLTINVNDDAPKAIAHVGTTLTEASLPAGTAPNAAGTSETGNLLTGSSFGADGAAAGGGISVAFTSGTSNGVSNDTATAVVAGGNTVITDSAGNVLTVNDTTGAYTYKLNAAYHDNANQPEVLTYKYTLTDSDGSTASNNLTINVTDDHPIAVNEAATTMTATINNNILTGDSFGADGKAATGGVSNVTNVGGTTSIAGGEITVHDSLGNELQVNQTTGAYDYIVNNPNNTAANESEVFHYTLTDGDGSTAAANLTITLTPNAPVANPDAATVDATSPLAVNAPGLLANDTNGANAVATVNGSAANVGATLTTTDGALVTVQSDGSYAYNTNGAFTNLQVGQSETDTFTYQAKNASGVLSNTTTDTITVTGMTINVNTFNDQLDNGGTTLGATISLRDALQYINSHPTDPADPYIINLPQGTYNITLLTGPSVNTGDVGNLVIDTTVILNGLGTGAIVNGQGNTADFNLVGGNVTMNQLTVTGGNGVYGALQVPPGDGGGGMTVSASVNLTLNNSHVDNNTTNDAGGGINSMGNIILTNSTVSGNASVNQGGGIYEQGGNLTLTNSQVMNDTANVGGGGIFLEDSSNTVITGSNISGNTATKSGGQAESRGGAMEIEDSNVTLTNDTLDNNMAGKGGALEIQANATNTNVTILQGQIDNNTATTHDMHSTGSAIFMDQNGAGVHDNVVIGSSATAADDVQISGNVANSNAPAPSELVINNNDSSTASLGISAGTLAGILANNPGSPDGGVGGAGGYYVDPIVFDLTNNNSIHLLSPNISPETVGAFTGTAANGQSIGWITQGEGILALNATGSQNITSISQLSLYDVAGLQAMDVNHTGVINASNPYYAELGLWVVGANNVGQFESLAQLGITSISLNAQLVNQTLTGGNVINSTLSFQTADGQNHLAADVSLAVGQTPSGQSLAAADVIGHHHSIDFSHLPTSTAPANNAASAQNSANGGTQAPAHAHSEHTSSVGVVEHQHHEQMLEHLAQAGQVHHHH